MHHRIGITLVRVTAATALCLFARQVAPAYSSGPPNFATGAPGESTCGVVGCHGNLNIGGGSVSLTAPSSYRPGDTIDIIVNLQMLGQKRWGFEATALDSLDNPVGSILVTDSSRTQLSVTVNSHEFIKHTTAGTDAGVLNQAPGWSFRWVAPAEGTGSVTFYVAGNAANNDSTNLGDYIYTSDAAVAQDAATGVNDDQLAALPSQIELKPNYPNPFNPSTTIAYTLPRGKVVALTVYDVLGRIVRTLESGYRAAGDHTAEWDGRDRSGNEVASGIYFYRLVAGDYTTTRKMVLAR